MQIIVARIRRSYYLSHSPKENPVISNCMILAANWYHTFVKKFYLWTSKSHYFTRCMVAPFCWNYKCRLNWGLNSYQSILDIKSLLSCSSVRRAWLFSVKKKSNVNLNEHAYFIQIQLSDYISSNLYTILQIVFSVEWLLRLPPFN